MTNKFQTLLSILRSNDHFQLNEDLKVEALQYWRERILDSLYAIFAILGLFAYVPSMYAAYLENSLAVGIINTLAYGMTLYIYFTDRLSYNVKAGFILAGVLGIALTLLLNIYVGYALIWIFVTPLLAGLLHGMKVATFAIITNVFILIFYGSQIYYNNAPWNSISGEPLLGWFVLSINFIFLNLITTFSVITLVEKLKLTIQKSELINKELDEEKNKLHEENKNRIRAELENVVITQKLHRASKMEAIGMLAGGVAHDLNNILSGLVSYPELLMMKLPKDSDIRKPLQKIHNSGLRAADVVFDLLTVARGAACEKNPYSLNTIIDEYLKSPEAMDLFTRNPEVIVEKKLSDSVRNIYCSHTHIYKSLMNLVTNSVEAIGGKGTISIRTSTLVVEKDPEDPKLPYGIFSVLEVKDSGKGISVEELNHIFEPFYTKKVMGRSGTGLGLTIVQNTVHAHDGSIVVTSNENGTRFKLHFPTTNLKIKELTTLSAEDLMGDGELILIIDDEDTQRKIASDVLQSLNYKTKTVKSGEAAIKYLQKNSVDLIMLDMIMTRGMNGLETYNEIIKFKPNQKSIIVSGFSDSLLVEEAMKAGVREYLSKPYTREKIALSIKNILIN